MTKISECIPPATTEIRRAFCPSLFPKYLSTAGVSGNGKPLHDQDILQWRCSTLVLCTKIKRFHDHWPAYCGLKEPKQRFLDCLMEVHIIISRISSSDDSLFPNTVESLRQAFVEIIGPLQDPV